MREKDRLLSQKIDVLDLSMDAIFRAMKELIWLQE
jgi:hypothetical protein